MNYSKLYSVSIMTRMMVGWNKVARATNWASGYDSGSKGKKWPDNSAL